jgi:hypothetical protein
MGKKKQDEPQPPLKKLKESGVMFRCACGETSGWELEARLPRGWTVRYLHSANKVEGDRPRRGERTWPQYTCPKCVKEKNLWTS